MNLGYACVYSPHPFEGEAELKWIRDNEYIGGYGIRTSEKALDWITATYGAKIYKVHETDPYLYHLDCSIFPLDNIHVLGCKAKIPKDQWKVLAKTFQMIDVPVNVAMYGACNSLRYGMTVFNANNNANYTGQVLKDGLAKNAYLENVCRQFGLEVVYTPLTQFEKGGGLMSCCVLHLTFDKSELSV
jgi:N-dimethylarginine dimethylaminohydrolase